MSLRQSFVATYALSAAVSVAPAAFADPPPNPTGCDAARPAAGARCTHPNLRCGYMACGNYFTQTMLCDPGTGQWRLEAVATCNPPPPPRPLPPTNPPRPQVPGNPPQPPPPSNPPPPPPHVDPRVQLPTFNPPPPPPHGNPPPPHSNPTPRRRHGRH